MAATPPTLLSDERGRDFMPRWKESSDPYEIYFLHKEITKQHHHCIVKVLSVDCWVAQNPKMRHLNSFLGNEHLRAKSTKTNKFIFAVDYIQA